MMLPKFLQHFFMTDNNEDKNQANPPDAPDSSQESRGLDRKNYKFDQNWIFTRFARIHVNGVFITDRRIWRKVDEDTAIKYLKPRTWGGRVAFPRKQHVATLFPYLRPQ